MDTNDIFEQMACQYDTKDRVNLAKIKVQAIHSELVDTKGKTALDYDVWNRSSRFWPNRLI